MESGEGIERLDSYEEAYALVRWNPVKELKDDNRSHLYKDLVSFCGIVESGEGIESGRSVARYACSRACGIR